MGLQFLRRYGLMGSWRPNPGAMNLEDPMATVIKKPCSPLPFRVGPASTLPGCKLGHRGIWTADKKRGIADVFVREDAEYLVHAGNVYPGLVEMLHDLAALDDGLHVRTVRAHALAKLRELGEVQS